MMRAPPGLRILSTALVSSTLKRSISSECGPSEEGPARRFGAFDDLDAFLAEFAPFVSLRGVLMTRIVEVILLGLLATSSTVTISPRRVRGSGLL
jgi:hypothetical protein